MEQALFSDICNVLIEKLDRWNVPSRDSGHACTSSGVDEEKHQLRNSMCVYDESTRKPLPMNAI